MKVGENLRLYSKEMLLAKDYGLNTCCMGGFDGNRLKELFNLSNDYISGVVIAIGKANEKGYVQLD